MELIKYSKLLFKFIVILWISLSLSLLFTIEGHCENVSIVIDPGHGGEAMGGNYEDRIERDIDLITALAMKERLEKYDGVDVYITRDNNTDKELSRKQRFDIAQKVNADFLISIHYNMSENHTLFGSEVWVASKGNNYVKGYAYGYLEMESFAQLGLFDRGIKNKLDKNKTGEYYGILKYAEDYNIPAVIVEHCHLDEERDSAFWNEDSYRLFGEIDADNMAKLFNLSSTELGIDNSEFVNISVEAPSKRLDVDSTEPEECNIEITKEENLKYEITISAFDSDTYIQYYQISKDGGRSFTQLIPWTDRSSRNEIIEINAESEDLEIMINVYNQYEGVKSSNIVSIPKLIVEEPVQEDEEAVYTPVETKIEITENSEGKISPVVVLLVTMGVLFVTFNIIFFVAVLANTKKVKKVSRQKSDYDWDL